MIIPLRLRQNRNEANNNLNDYSIATSVFTSKNDVGNVNDKIDIAGNMKNVKQNFPKNKGNLLFNENSNSISQIKKNGNLNNEIKEEINELNKFEKDSFNNDNVNYNINNISNNLSENQMNDLENDINKKCY